MHDFTQSRLLRWAALFLFAYSATLTISPAVRERTWDVDYRLSHWIGFIAWVVLITFAHRATSKQLPERDPYLLPAAAFLAGWGLLTIWRLDEVFGLRQTIWLSVSVLVFILALYSQKNLSLLRQYKYVLLSGGLLITALTLIFGTNPLGAGPRLWLGCCGVYFQPSEPLKLLLVIYLSAYLADRIGIGLLSSRSTLLFPTLVVTGLALLLLLVQRDLGTASIFICIFTIIIFLVTGKRRVLIGTVFFLAIALFVGYFFIGVIQIRVAGWLNPWDDPSGNSYQIVQSLLAVANGGTIGRGTGLGSPLLVPVAISDFIYAAIAEESGLTGTVGLLAMIWLILARGLMASLRAVDRFRRYLAAGVVTYLGIQSLLIIGGNLRLLPLTGVTLPFVSYGGSSLLTSFIALFILLVISSVEDGEPAPLDQRPYSFLAGFLALGLASCALTTAWWAVIRAPDLLNRTDNPRRAISDRYVPRGELLDRNNQPINVTKGASGAYARVYLYPDIAPITGYTHPVYGQAGLEASLDDYLRGLQGNPASTLWWDRLIYGTPPPGLNVRLSIDLALQSKADELLGDHSGAIVLMNAETGEILAMASHPTYDPNKLDEEGDELSQNSSAPLLNRATQGLYPIGTAMQPLILAEFGDVQPTDSQLSLYYQRLGLYQAPAINMPVSFDTENSSVNKLRISPLQAILSAALLSNQGVIPAPRIAMAVNTPQQGWVVLSEENQPIEAIQAEVANAAALGFIEEGKPYWSHIGQASTSNTTVTWLLAGTLSDWGGVPLALVVTLEEDNTLLAGQIGDSILDSALDQ